MRALKTKYRPKKKAVPNKDRSVTPLIYFGGKSRDAEWIVNHFPPHHTFVDVFGGGAAVSLFKFPSVVDVYNDIGNVCLFLKVLRNWPDELYEALSRTPYSRQEFYNCKEKWCEMQESLIAVMATSNNQYREFDTIPDDTAIEWARCWYVTIIEGHTHEENDASWKVAKKVDVAFSWANHVDDLPRHADKLRRMIIENLDFARVIKMYDSEQTLFYLDPPYMPGTRVAGGYTHEMPESRHKEMLELLQKIKGQAVVSGYHHFLYDTMLKGWAIDTITHKSSIQNSEQMKNGRDDRTEVLWIKEHEHGLWTQLPPPISPPVVSRVSAGEKQ